MIEKPIIFSTPMIQAILEGRKTQTRRVIKPQPSVASDGWITHHKPQIMYPTMESFIRSKCPYNADILWVRETWGSIDAQNIRQGGYDQWYVYKATPKGELPEGFKWRPSIFMPREAARIFLKVKNVRVERLQDISRMDIKAEGIYQPCLNCGKGECIDTLDCGLKHAFKNLWDSLNAKRGYGWEKNCWTWVVEFERQ